MIFYADQANDFAPALKWIHQNTGLNEKDISKIRTQLIKNGFIRYKPAESIDLDWNRIRLYSTLDKDMLPSKRGKATIALSGSISHGVIHKPPPKIKWLLWKYPYSESAPVRELSPAEKKFYGTLENMTEEQVRNLFGGIEPIQVDDRPTYMKYGDTQYEDTADEKSERPAEQLPGALDPLPF